MTTMTTPMTTTVPQARRAGWWNTPRHRPPAVLRIGVGLIGVGVVAFNVVLMMSDRAPRALRFLSGDVIDRLSARIDAGGRGEFRAGARRLASDATLHAAVWGLAIVFVALALWTWGGLVVSAVGVFVASIAVELGQDVFSTTRRVEGSDVFFNGFGIVIGSAVVAAVFWAWNAGARVRRVAAVRRRRH